MESGGSIKEFNYSFDITKSTVNDTLYIYGVASTQDTDRDGEVVSMKSLEKAFHRYMQTSPVLMNNHDGKSMAVGKVISEYTGEDGTVYKSGVINNELRIVGQISQAGSASDVRIQVEEGIIKSFSIGGRAKLIQKDGKRCLMVSDLREISLVTIPANAAAMFTVIKSACVGNDCPVRDTKEVDNMEKEDIITLVKGVIIEMRTADDYEALQKKYDALLASKTDPEVKVVDPQVDIAKALTEKIDALQTELDAMKTTPVKKGIQEGDEPVEKAATDITSAIMARHYGGA